MKRNVKRRMGHNIQQKEKKNWSQCACAWSAICSSDIKKERVGNFLPMPKTCLSSSSLSKYLVGVKNWLKISITTMFSSKVVKVYSLCQFLSICFLKKFVIFYFYVSAWEPKQQGRQGYSWISPTRNDSEITLEC